MKIVFLDIHVARELPEEWNLIDEHQQHPNADNHQSKNNEHLAKWRHQINIRSETNSAKADQPRSKAVNITESQPLYKFLHDSCQLRLGLIGNGDDFFHRHGLE